MAGDNSQSMEERKKDHIDLAFKSRMQAGSHDSRFFYEPMMSAHPEELSPWDIPFLDKRMRYPIWISSMTGGTAMAGLINKNLALAAKEFGLGMGLGSCRIILDDDKYFDDFNLRPVLGDEVPFFANLGIAQVESLLAGGRFTLIEGLVQRLRADGLIIHVNPLQEWLQPEGDRIKNPPIDTIRKVLDLASFPLIIKEVGQGMGPASLRALMELPLGAIEFAAYGGTNFSKLELMRASEQDARWYQPFAQVGHSAAEMLEFTNNLLDNPTLKPRIRHLIISGGIQDALDAYHLISSSRINAVYGQASSLLEYARGDYEILQKYLRSQIASLNMARAFLHKRP
jgi:isopentenyl-diphosphate Delta-isomerase